MTQYRSTSGSAANPLGTMRVEWFSEEASVKRKGWIAGAGVEYALDARWSLRGEYLRSDYSRDDVVFDEARAGVGRTYSVTVTLRDPVTNAILRDPVTNAILRQTTTYPGKSDTINGRVARNTLTAETFRLGLNYRL